MRNFIFFIVLWLILVLSVLDTEIKCRSNRKRAFWVVVVTTIIYFVVALRWI